jgi:hypothetical protein
MLAAEDEGDDQTLAEAGDDGDGNGQGYSKSRLFSISTQKQDLLPACQCGPSPK